MKERSSWKAAVLTLLCMLTAATLSLVPNTMARFAAQTDAQASARVAAWNPVWTPRASNLDNAAIGGIGALNTGIVFRPGNWTTTRHVDWRATNLSEVAMESYIIPMRVIVTEDADTEELVVERRPLAASDFPGGLLTLPSTTPQFVPIGGFVNFRFSIQGYVTAPTRHANDVNTGAITATAPIRFGAGTNTYDVETLWRTVRINADGIDAQVD